MKPGDSGQVEQRGPHLGLTKPQSVVLLHIAKSGRHGVTAREIFPHNEGAAMAIAMKLLRRKLVMTTRDNRFMLVKYKDDRLSGSITWDDHRRTGFVEPEPNAPLPPLHPKPEVVDVSGHEITKLPPGEARGVRDKPTPEKRLEAEARQEGRQCKCGYWNMAHRKMCKRCGKRVAPSATMIREQTP